MSLSSPFIKKPVATTLLTAAVALAGAVAFRLLPVSPLPQVDFPTVSVQASMAGASPEIMASSVATPLERQFGRIAGVTEMTSSSSLGQTNVTLQFDLSRNIDAAARDVHARILPLMSVNFVESNPQPVKYAMAAMGLLEEVYRLPMVSPKAESKDKINTVLKDLRLLKAALV